MRASSKICLAAITVVLLIVLSSCVKNQTVGFSIEQYESGFLICKENKIYWEESNKKVDGQYIYELNHIAYEASKSISDIEAYSRHNGTYFISIDREIISLKYSRRNDTIVLLPIMEEGYNEPPLFPKAPANIDDFTFLFSNGNDPDNKNRCLLALIQGDLWQCCLLSSNGDGSDYLDYGDRFWEKANYPPLPPTDKKITSLGQNEDSFIFAAEDEVWVYYYYDRWRKTDSLPGNVNHVMTTGGNSAVVVVDSSLYALPEHNREYGPWVKIGTIE